MGKGKPFIELVQIHSDESDTTLKMSGPSFYTFLICFRNVSDETRRRLIVNGATLVMYLHCKFNAEMHVNNDDDYLSTVNDSIPR